MRGGAAQGGLLGSSLPILVEGSLSPRQGKQKRSCVVEAKDYESAVGFVKSRRRQEVVELERCGLEP